MKAVLTDYVTVDGSSTRHVELARIDWTRRAVWLPDGRWIPFERVIVGDPEPTTPADRVTEIERLMACATEAYHVGLLTEEDWRKMKAVALHDLNIPQAIGRIGDFVGIVPKDETNGASEERIAYVCDCGKPFLSPQALGGHKRHCTAAP